MNGDLFALIPDYVLGLLPEDRRRELDALAADSPVFREEVDRVAESLAGGADRLEPALPPPTVRARLLRTLDGVERFAPFLEDLGQLFQLPAERMKALLARIDDAEGWESTLLGVPLQGARLFHFTVGPTLAAAGAAGGVVRIAPGVTFPRHTHHGPEVTYVLEGGYCVDDRVYHPGSSIGVTGEAAHTYRSAPGRDLVLAVLHHGIAMVKEN